MSTQHNTTQQAGGTGHSLNQYLALLRKRIKEKHLIQSLFCRGLLTVDLVSLGYFQVFATYVTVFFLQ